MTTFAAATGSLVGRRSVAARSLPVPAGMTPSGVDVASYEWSPDGRRLAYLDHRGALRLVRADGTGGMRLAVRGLIVGIGAALATIFVPTWARSTAPVYAVAE